MFSLEKKRLRGDFITCYSYLIGGYSKVDVSLFSDDKWLDLKWPQVMLGRFRLDIRNNSLREGVGKNWNELPREVMESPFLGILKRHVDMELRDMV